MIMWHRFSKKIRKRLPVGSGFSAHLFMEFAAHWWKVGSTAPAWSLQQRPLYNYLKQTNLADDILSSSCLSRGSITEKLQSRLQRLASSVSIINWKSSGLFFAALYTDYTNIPQHSGETNWLICAVYNYRRYTNVCVWVRLAFASLAFMPLHGRLPSS